MWEAVMEAGMYVGGRHLGCPAPSLPCSYAPLLPCSLASPAPLLLCRPPLPLLPAP